MYDSEYGSLIKLARMAMKEYASLDYDPQLEYAQAQNFIQEYVDCDIDDMNLPIVTEIEDDDEDCDDWEDEE